MEWVHRDDDYLINKRSKTVHPRTLELPAFHVLVMRTYDLLPSLYFRLV